MTAVRCVDCGLLGLRDSQTGLLLEVSEVTRTEGYGTKKKVVCSALAANLDDEAFPPGKNLSVETLAKLRTCDSFCQWSPGLWPSEHKAMIIEVERQKLADESRRMDADIADRRLKAQREFDEQRRKSDRRWQIFITLLAATVGWMLRSSPQPAPEVKVFVAPQLEVKTEK